MKITIEGSVSGQSAVIAAEFAKILSKFNIKTTMEIEHLALTDRMIPAIKIYDKGDKGNDSSKLPVVFLLHGRTGDKSLMINYGVRLAQHGFMAVAIDAREHGERKTSDFNQIFSNAIVQAPIIDIVRNTASDISYILDHFIDDPRIDINRIGISGYSMGGTITFLTALTDKRIKAAAPMIDSPDYSKYGDAESTIGENSEIYKAIAEYSPISNIEKFYPIALLVQNGDSDEYVPVQGPRSFSEKILEYYKDTPDRYKYIEYPGVGHDVPDAMIITAVDWFKKYL